MSQDTNSGWRNNREFSGGIGVKNILLIDGQGKILSASRQHDFAHADGLNTYSDFPQSAYLPQQILHLRYMKMVTREPGEAMRH